MGGGFGRELYSHKWEYGEEKQGVRCFGGNICAFFVEMLDTAEPLLGAKEQPSCFSPPVGWDRKVAAAGAQEWGRMSANIVFAAPGVASITSTLPSSPPKGQAFVPLPRAALHC